MSKFDEIIENGYEFEMSRYINEGWDLFKKGAASFIGFTALYFLISIIMAFIPLVNILSNVIQYVLVAGFFIYCRQLVMNKAEFNDFFGGFKHFGQLFLYLLVLFLFLIPVFVLLFTVLLPFDLLPQIVSGSMDWEYFLEEWAASLEGNIGTIMLLYFLIFCVVIYIYLSYTFTIPLIVDEKMQFWQAMETSRKVISKKFFSFLIMFIILGLIFMVATLVTCGLGMLAAIPFLYCVIFVSYDRILNPHQNTEIDQVEEFGKEEKDINTESEDTSTH